MIRLAAILTVLLALQLLLPGKQAASRQSATISYQLPPDGPLPRTYRVTLAITDPNNSDWIISTFAAGVARTVTEQNRGQFTEVWDGLDDSLMPVAPGRYGVKGIYMPAKLWPIDDQYHSIVARYLGAADSWAPSRGDDHKTLIVPGDPTGYPLADVAVTPDGIGVFCYAYLENAKNHFLFDLKKPIDYDQVLSSYPSWGAGGGSSATTDGQTVWSFTGDLPIVTEFIYRADKKPFGSSNGRYMKNIYHPAGWITSMASWRDPKLKRSFVYAAERGALIPGNSPVLRGRAEVESSSSFVNRIVVLDGQTGAELATAAIFKPRSLAVHGDRLYVLHELEAGGFAVNWLLLDKGLPHGSSWQKQLTVPADIRPTALAVNSRGSIYLSDSQANKVYKLADDGRRLITYGRLAAQKPGTYDRLSFIAPEKLAAWTDPGGQDRLIVLEAGGPNRVTEWSDDGKLLREWMVAQTKSNGGYAVDPHDADLIYLLGQRGWLDRFRVDPTSGKWTTDAVWPDVGKTLLGHTDINNFNYPKIIYRGNTRYLVSGYNYSIFRMQDGTWVPSAGLVSEGESRRRWYIWRDVNGNGKVEPEEYKGNLTEPPQGTLRYFGESWLDDLSLVAIGQGTADIWRLAPTGFDQYGNPIFDPQGWKKIITDPVFAAKASRAASPLRGGDEVANAFDSPWAMITGSMTNGFFVNARGGPSFSANFGAQNKVMRYLPAGGNFQLKWRVGRTVLEGVAKPGEIYSSIFIDPPMNGILGVVDNSRAGYLLYTEDGLYVDTLLADSRSGNPDQFGVYAQPQEFFAGHDYADSTSGKIRLAWGKTEPILYNIDGWNLKETPVHRLTGLPPAVTLEAGQIAPAAPVAMKIRGVADPPKMARINSAPRAGPALDGSLSGWKAAVPITFNSSSNQSVEVRCLYDPDHLYVRWHVRLGRRFQGRDLEPGERIFVHDRHADTVSLYLQGDPAEKATSNSDGRPGDVRFVFGMFNDRQQLRPVVLGLYPKWYGPGQPAPMTYRSPVGTVKFENAALLTLPQLKGILDPDAMGFVIAAAIPRNLVPTSPALPGLRTTINFEATLGGESKFWWSNVDGSGSRETSDEPSEARLYPGSWSPAQFLPE